MTAAERIAAYESAVAHPFHVRAYASWADYRGVTVGFQTESEARRFASLRPEPLIDLVRRERGVIASRRLVQHPQMSAERRFMPVDDFPDTRD